MSHPTVTATAFHYSFQIVRLTSLRPLPLEFFAAQRPRVQRFIREAPPGAKGHQFQEWLVLEVLDIVEILLPLARIDPVGPTNQILLQRAHAVRKAMEGTNLRSLIEDTPPPFPILNRPPASR